MRINKSLKTILILILVFLISASIFVFYILGQLNNRAGSGDERLFLVKQGEGVSDIAQNLQNQKLINSTLAFRIYIAWQGKAGSIQAGEYQLSPWMTIRDIAERLISGQIKEFKITIPEGWNLKEIASYLEKEGIVKSQEFLAEVSNLPKYKKGYDFLSSVPASKNLEGFLFPDTYFLPDKVDSETIIRKMLENFSQKLTSEIREKIKNKKMTIYSFITLASIVEKEVPNYEDKKIVAGIFYKRLANDMALESCASVEYVIGNNRKILNYEEMHTDSPYNTYIYKGLPPGPISNPGMDSILASLEPTKTDYWYFLSPDSERTIFSKTLEEHELNQAKYLK